MKKEHIVYVGKKFTIEWYFNENDKSQAQEYFDALTRERKLDAFALFKTMADIGKILNITKFRNEGDGIYAFKPKPDRFMSFFFTQGKIIITNAFEKKQDKLPPREKKKAIDCEKDYIIRVKRGDYYD